MNINDWNDRIKHRYLPENFNHEGSEKFISNYEYCKSLSNYHFDTTVEDDSQYYATLGKFDLDFSEELNFAIENKISKPLKDRPWAVGEKNPLEKQESYDKMIMGIPDDYIPYYHVSNNLIREKCPRLVSMMDYFQFEKYVFGLQIQQPGQFLQLHIDKFQHRYPSDTSKIVRLQIFLTDYDYGQMFSIGNDVYSHWKKGQILIEDWHNVPHSMINAGKEPLCWISMIGIRSDKSDEVFASLNADTVIKMYKNYYLDL